MIDRTVRLAISGRVQGVGYRDWTVTTARRFGLRGWVRNRIDGSVEAMLAGDAASVASMVEACRRGPSLARVERVDVTEAEADLPDGFTLRPTG